MRNNCGASMTKPSPLYDQLTARIAELLLMKVSETRSVDVPILTLESLREWMSNYRAAGKEYDIKVAINGFFVIKRLK